MEKEHLFLGILLLFICLLLGASFFNLDIAIVPEGTEIIINSSGENVVEVEIQDVYSEPIDFYLYYETGTTNPSNSYALGSTEITVDSVTGAELYNVINIKSDTRFYQGLISNINVNTLTISPAIDFNITPSDTVIFGDYNLNKDGSTTPLTYSISPPANLSWDIYTINFAMENTVAMDDATFGGLPALTNGIYFKRVDGITKNFWLIYSNGGFGERGFNTQYSAKAPAGSYGFTGTKNIKTVTGVSLRLNGDTDDYVGVDVNDDLTGLDKLVFVVNGHVVEN